MTNRTLSLTKRLTLDAMLVGFALILSYLETLLPLTAMIPIPGIKPGLPNICVMLTFFAIGRRDAFAVSLVRVCMAGMLFSSPVTLLFSLSGALFSFGGLLLLERAWKKEAVSFVGVSVACASLHQIGQTLAASVLYRGTAILHYLPLLLLAAVVTGALTGWLLNLIFPRTQKLIRLS